jgi:hypothetical protein
VSVIERGSLEFPYRPLYITAAVALIVAGMKIDRLNPPEPQDEMIFTRDIDGREYVQYGGPESLPFQLDPNMSDDREEAELLDKGQ